MGGSKFTVKAAALSRGVTPDSLDLTTNLMLYMGSQGEEQSMGPEVTGVHDLG